MFVNEEARMSCNPMQLIKYSGNFSKTRNISDTLNYREKERKNLNYMQSAMKIIKKSICVVRRDTGHAGSQKVKRVFKKIL